MNQMKQKSSDVTASQGQRVFLSFWLAYFMLGKQKVRYCIRCFQWKEECKNGQRKNAC